MSSKKKDKVQDFKGLKVEFDFSENQKLFIRKVLAQDTNLVFIDGPAGTSKTYLAVYCALTSFFKGWTSSIKYIRTLDQSGRVSSGALPGSETEKMNPFSVPLYDKVHEFLSGQEVRSFLCQDKVLEAFAVNYCRGASWKNSFVIVDEAQNFSEQELTTVLTRIGSGSRAIVCGDLMQADCRVSGFKKFIDTFSDPKSESMGIYSFRFSEEDIVRSELVKFIVGKINGRRQ